MRKRLLLCGAALVVLFVLSAMPSHAVSATGGQFNTPYLVFGTQPVGQSGLTQTGILTFGTGVGPVVVTINSITVSGANAGDFTAMGVGATPCNVGTVLNVDVGSPASCTLGGVFTPTATGARTATITVNWSVSAGVNDGPVTLNVVGGDEVVYVTTGLGGQVLTVDGTTPNTFQVLSNGPACNTTGCFQPTGAVVGPDGKIYVTDQTNSNIWRMNQDGSQVEEVYNQANCTLQLELPCAKFPEGPSFSGSGTGDLYFNTFVQSGPGTGTLEIPGVATTAFGQGFNLPVSVEPCQAGNTDCAYTGSGTGFDASGNLLTADQEDNDVWSLSPPYSGTPTAILSGANSIDAPTGIALNKANSQMYVANSDGSQQILQIVPPAVPTAPYTTATYYAFSTTSQCGTDFPDYFQFDMTGHLFTTTSASPQPGGANNCGKVWRIDPGPTATLLLDLNTVNGSGIAGICGPGACGLNGAQAIGLAMPPTAGSTQTVGLSASGGTATVGWPIGCTPSNAPGNNCSSTIGIQYPANMFGSGDVLNVTFNEVTQAQFAARTAGTPYSSTSIAPVEGYNGDGIIASLVCTNGGSPCSDAVIPGTAYNIFTTWQSNQTNYCSLIPHLFRGDPVGGPYTSLLDTLINCEDGGVGAKGQSSCSSTSSSSCLSDWPNAFGPTTGSTSTTKVTASITSPSNGAAFSFNGAGIATFSCSPSANPPVVFCLGSVIQPDGTLVSVSNGGPLPSSQIGTYTLSVNAEVNGGAPPPTSTLSATAQYTVSGLQFIGFAAPINNTGVNVAKAGQAVPIAFQVLDANGNPVTNLTMPAVSIIFTPTSCANFSAADNTDLPDVTASGNSGFQNLGGGNYQLNWKTSKSQTGCGLIQVNLGDGVAHTAEFQFK